MRLSTLLVLTCAVSTAFGGDGPGDGAASGGTKESSALESNSRLSTATTASSPLITGGAAGDAKESSALVSNSLLPTATTSSPPRTTGEKVGENGGGDGGGTGSTPSEGKSDGEGGEGTTPVDPFVLIPLFLLVGAAIILFIARILIQQKSKNRPKRGDSDKYRPSVLWFLWLRIRYAPLFSKRHSREFRPFKWLHMGTLPTRLEVYLMVIYFALNIIFIVASIDWSEEEMSLKMYGLRNHSGTLGTANLILVVLTVGRNNPLIPLLNISFDSFNTMHRYLGRLVVVETLLHIAAVLATKVPTSGWGIVPQELWGKELVLYGFISSIMFVVIITQAWAPFRHAFYETFLIIHVVLSIGAFVTLWYHLETLQHRWLMIGIFVAWGFERVARVVLILWRFVGNSPTRATIELLSNNMVRVSIKVARPWKVLPGQHLFLYMPSIALWTSHPFSIAWVETVADTETLSYQKSQVIYLLIKAENGFTKILAKKAAISQSWMFSTVVLVEGAYGGLESPSSFESVVLVAGGIGVTHQLLHIRDLITSYQYRVSQVRHITLAWAIRSEAQIEWIQPWLVQLLAQHAQAVRRDSPLRIRVLIYISSPTELNTVTYHVRSVSGASATPILDSGDTNVLPMDTIPLGGQHDAALVETFYHRMNPYSLIDTEIKGPAESVYVSVCGPGGLADDVRDAVRRQLKHGEKAIEFFEEAFSW